MAMAGWQRLSARVRSQTFVPLFARTHHFLCISPEFQSFRLGFSPLPGPEFLDDSYAAAIRGPFMQTMAVPKRKVSPSRKGKRNGPKALRPVPVVAQCTVCGRIKLPHLYCCSGEPKKEKS